jgi:hypothetical protein
MMVSVDIPDRDVEAIDALIAASKNPPKYKRNQVLSMQQSVDEYNEKLKQYPRSRGAAIRLLVKEALAARSR